MNVQQKKNSITPQEYQQLQSSHDSLRSIIDSTSDLIGAINWKFEFTIFNEAYKKEIYELFGTNLKTGMQVQEVVQHHPEYQDDALALWGNALKGETFTVTRMYNHPEHHLVYYEYTFNPIKNQEGKVVGAVQVVRNQTDKIRAQQKVKDIEEFVQLAELIPQKIWGATPNGNSCYVNHRFLEYTGHIYEELMDYGWTNIVHPDDLATVLKKWNASMKSGKPYEAEYRLRNHQGEYMWHLCRSLPMHDSSGNIVKWMGTATNIHKRKLLEQENKKNISEFEFLIDMIPHIVWKALPSGEVVFYNKKWSEYTGIPQNEGAKGLWKMVPHPDDVEPTLKAWQHSVETGDTYKIEHRIATKDGTFRWVLSHALPLKDAEGKIVMWYGTATDIHDEKTYLEELIWMQKQMQERNKELTKVNIDLDNFVYTASHDLRTPILNLASLLTMLEERIDEKTAQSEQQIIKMMKVSMERLENTINDLSEIAKLQKEKENQEDLLFQDLYDEVNQDLENNIRKTKANITTGFKVKEIHYPAKHLRSILYNLISNAIKYAHPDRSPDIKIQSWEEEGQVYLSVSDNGLGLDQRQQKKLFQMFTRLHTHVSGTGVGLYMIKRIVENNGGKISVKSAAGKGSTFTVCFS